MKSPQNQPEPQNDELDKLYNLIEDMFIAGKLDEAEVRQAIEAWGRKQQISQLQRYMNQRCGCMNCNQIADDFSELQGGKDAYPQRA